MFWTVTRAFAFWLDIVCVIYIAIITYALVEMNVENVPGGNVGLAITQIIGLIGMTQVKCQHKDSISVISKFFFFFQKYSGEFDKQVNLKTKWFALSVFLNMQIFHLK